MAAEDDSDIQRVIRRVGGEETVDRAFAEMVITELRGTRRDMAKGFDALQDRLAKGDTRFALIEERQGNQGAHVASLVKRFDELERMTRALACDECESRIERLEDAEKARAAIEADAVKRNAWQPPWWLMLLLTILAGVATAVAAARLGA